MTASDQAGAATDANTGTRKVAALLLAMGKPLADRVLKHFSDPEIRRVVETTVRLGSVPRDKVEAFADEMAAAFERGADVRASADDVEGLLTGVVSADLIASLMSGFRADTQRSVWLRLGDIPETNLHQFLTKEHPQIAALILAKAGPTQAATALRLAPAAMRAELVRRILAMRPVTDTAQTIAEEGVRDELLVKISKEMGPPVHSRIADIINKMDRQQMEEVLSDLELRRPKDAKLVKGLLFTFDDISRLSSADRVKLFDAVPVERTIMALQGASAALREQVLASVSSRSRRMIEQEISGGASLPARDITKARRLIADHALELAERGQIDIAQQEEQ